jgi:hypothetical protein
MNEKIEAEYARRLDEAADSAIPYAVEPPEWDKQLNATFFHDFWKLRLQCGPFYEKILSEFLSNKT